MGKIISIHSFRGGTGKSNLCANLAAQAALAGYRVGIVDTDIQSPGIHVIFGLDEKKMGPTVNDFLHGKATVEQVAYPVGEVAHQQAGLQKLSGKSLWLFPSSIDAGEISRIIKQGYDFNMLNSGLQGMLRGMKLDYLFIDTHPGLNDETLLSIAVSDILLVVLRPDQQDFQGTAVTVTVAQSLDVPDLNLVVNKALTKYDLNQVRQEVEEKYHVPVAGVLPLTEDMADLGSSDLFSLCYPDHPWSRCLRDVAQVILR